jgi:RimJ/RimL family protein N-acetyltransferase
MFLNEVSSGRIHLRPFLKSDIETWMKWRIDPEVQNYLPEPHDVEASYESEVKFFSESESAEDEIHAAVTDAASGELLGTISITGMDEHHGVGELGIIIGNKAYWGKGYATEAIRVFLNEIKETKGLRRILAEFEEENIAMRKALENSGFELETLSKKSRIKNRQPIDTLRYVTYL